MLLLMDCGGSIKFCRARFARLAAGGSPDPGDDNLIITDKAMRLKWTPVYLEGETIQVKTGCGDLAINEEDPPVLTRWDVELEIATADWTIYEILCGGDTIESGGDVIGYASPELGISTDSDGVSIEAWSKYKIGDQTPAEDPFLRWVFARVKNWKFAGDRELANGALAHVFTGEAYENDAFLDGPENDWLYISGRSWAVARDAEMPDAVCGYQTLVAS